MKNFLTVVALAVFLASDLCAQEGDRIQFGEQPMVGLPATLSPPVDLINNIVDKDTTPFLESNRLGYTALNNSTAENSAFPPCTNYNLSFDGVDDYVNIPDDPAISPCPTCPFTVELWVFRVSPAGVQHIMGKRVGCTDPSPYWQMAFDGGGLSFGGSGGGGVSTGASLPMNDWRHLAGVFDGAQFFFYMDGNQIGTGVGIMGAGAGAPLKLASSGDCPPSQNFGGKMDEVRIWNVARTQAQIQGAMNECISPSEPGLVGLWRLNEGVGITAHDLTANANDGTLINGPMWMTSMLSIVCDPATADISPSNPMVDCATPSTTLTASGGGTYAWSNSLGNNASVSVSPATTTTYTVTVTNSSGCTDVASVSVQVDNTPPSIVISPANPIVSCTVSTVTLTASGGGAYEWSNGENAGSINVSPTMSTAYTVTVTAANGCTGTASTTVQVANAPLSVNITPSSAVINCITPSTTLTTTGGGSYVWSDGLGTNPSITVAPPSTTTYTVTVTAPNGCTGTASSTVTVDNTPPIAQISPSTTSVNCSVPSSVVTASGGGTYLWSHGLGTNASVTVTPTAMTTYTVTVTAPNGCTDTESIVIGVDNTQPMANVTPASTLTNCNNPTTSLTASGGGTYAWNNGLGANATVTVHPASTTTYTVTVTAANGCTNTASATVTVDNQPPTASVTPTSSTINCLITSAGLTASGGGTYMWSHNLGTSANVTVTPAVTTTFTVTVTAANGCTVSNSATVLVDNTPPLPGIAPAAPIITCYNPSVALTAIGGGTYLWSNGLGANAVVTVNPPVATTYTVTVTASNGCTASTNVTVLVDNAPPTAGIIPSTAVVNCSVPSVNLTATGGGFYLWSNGLGTNATVTATPSATTTYTVTVTAANGCTDIENMTILVDNAPPTAGISPASAFVNCLMPSVSFTASGGGTYLWSNNLGSNSTATATPPSTTTYTVTVTAANGCTDTETVTVTVDNLPPIASVNPVSPVTTCDDPEAVLTASGGGTYFWSNNLGTAAVVSVNPVSSITYTVTITAPNGCTDTESVLVTVDKSPPSVFITPVSPTVNCFVPAANLTASGGVLYSWSNSLGSSPTVTVSPALTTTYTVTVTAANGCTNMGSATVSVNTIPPVAVISPTAALITCAVPYANISASGGIAYLWSDNLGANASVSVSPVSTTTYTVTVTAANGCTDTASVTISVDNQPPLANIVATTTTINCVELSSTLTATGGGTYSWNNGLGAIPMVTVEPSSTTIYTVIVTAPNGCTDTESVTITVDNVPPDIVFINTPATCGLSNGLIDLFTSGISFFWSNGAQTEDLSNIPAGTYTVNVTGANGCLATATSTIPNNNIPINISGATLPLTSCTAPNGAINLSVTPVNSYSYQWSNSSTAQNLSNIITGMYTVTVTLGVSCSSSATFNVPNNTSSPVIDANITGAICGLSNGAIDLTISGSVPPYTFVWSNGAQSPNISAIASGNYSVVVTGGNGCVDTAAFNVPNNSNTFSLSGTALAVTNCTSPNGVINLQVTPAGAYSFTWSNGDTTQNITGLNAGAYDVTVNGSGNCAATASFILTNDTPPPAAGIAVMAATCGLADGNVDLTVTGGVLPYGYVWSNGAMVQNLVSVVSGVYTVTVTGANGCTATATAAVPENTVSFALAATTLANTGCTQNTGSIDLSITPAGAYTYSWSNMATTEDLTALAAGTYTVVATYGANCSTSASFTVADNLSVPSVSAAAVPDTCRQGKGSVMLAVAGGTQPYTFSWSNMAATQNVAALSAGAYSVIVTGGNGCKTETSIDVPDFKLIFGLSGVTTDVTSCVQANGGVDLSVTPSNAYKFLWSNNETTEDIGMLAANTYTVTVTLGNSCSSSSTFTVGNTTPAPVLSQAATPDTCQHSIGHVKLSITGTGPFNIIWSNGATSAEIGNQTAGTYSVTVTDANGCTATAIATVANEVIALNTNATIAPDSSCLSGTGQVTLTVSPGGNYTYQWSNGSFSQNIDGLASGDYTVTVSAGGACTTTATYKVADGTLHPVVSQNITPALCAQPVGRIDLTVGGAPAPYTFLWSNNATTEDVTNLVKGTYTVSVSAANGCAVVSVLTVPDSSSNFNLSGLIVPKTACTQNNGSVQVTVSPIGAYTYVWSNNASTANLDSLAVGTYMVTVSDANLCTASASFTITENLPQLNINGVVSNVWCYGDTTGSIDISASGGTQPYTYTWVPSVAGNPEDLTNLKAGTYSLILTEAGGCATNTNFVVQQPPSAVTASCTTGAEPSAPGASDGSGKVALSGGVAPYTVTWSPGGVQPNVPAGVFDIVNLPTGSYNVTVSDANGCSQSCAFDVPEASCLLEITGSVNPNTACISGNGNISVLVTPPNSYSYSWSNGLTTSGIGNLSPGNYTVTVSTDAGCTASVSFTVTSVPAAPTLAIVASPAICGQNNGSIDLTVNGAQPFIFRWSTGATGEDLNSVAPGSFAVTVTSGNGCTASATATVQNIPSDLSAKAEPVVQLNGFAVSCAGANDGALNGLPSGGQPPYTWQWSNGSMEQNLSDLTAGIYTLTVTDAFGCTAIAAGTLTQPPGYSVNATPHTPACEAKGKISITVFGTTAPYLYSLDGAPFITDSVFQNVPAGDHTVIAQDINGCEVPVDIYVDAPPILTLVLLPGDTTILLGDSLELGFQANFLTDSLYWSPVPSLSCMGCPNPVAKPLASQIYQLTATTTDGCSAIAALTLLVNKDRRVFIPNIFAPAGNGLNDSFYLHAGTGVTRVISAYVFDRWGSNVFTQINPPLNDPTSGWDGTWKGQTVTPGVYVYFFKVEFVDGTTEVFEGDVTVLR